jgi:hypothetical protein
MNGAPPLLGWQLAALAALAAAGCASQPADELPHFDQSVGLVEVELDGGEFGRCDGDRLPFEAIVLRLRQRVRPLSADDRKRFVVEVRLAPHPFGSAAGRRAERQLNRLVDELHIMEVEQVRLL